ncbi:unnamed protein product [Lampetra fluviatilis]
MTRRVRRPTRDACELTVAGAGGGRGAVERGEVEKEEVEEEHKREEGEEEEIAAEGRIRPGGFHRTALLSLLSADFLSTALRIYTPARPPASREWSSGQEDMEIGDKADAFHMALFSR